MQTFIPPNTKVLDINLLSCLGHLYVYSTMTLVGPLREYPLSSRLRTFSEHWSLAAPRTCVRHQVSPVWPVGAFERRRRSRRHIVCSGSRAPEVCLIYLYLFFFKADSFNKYSFSQLALVERPAPEAAPSCVTLHMPDGTFSQIEIQRRQETLILLSEILLKDSHRIFQIFVNRKNRYGWIGLQWESFLFLIVFFFILATSYRTPLP